MKLQKTLPKVMTIFVMASLFLAACGTNGSPASEPTEIVINMAEEAATETTAEPAVTATSAPTLPPTEAPAPTATLPAGEPTPIPSPTNTLDPYQSLIEGRKDSSG